MKRIILPLYIEIPRKTMKPRRVGINLNETYLKHRMCYNNAKKQYKAELKPQLEGLKFDKINVEFLPFWGDKRRRDKDNVVAMSKKFFFDALTELECIVDDNDDYIKHEYTHPSVYDKGNGRLEVIITDYEEVS